MNQCICSSCRNLKCSLPDEEEDIFFECEFGFPSDECEACETNECDRSCSHYESDDEEIILTIKCKKCGKELKKAFKDDSEGDILCVDCYLGG